MEQRGAKGFEGKDWKSKCEGNGWTKKKEDWEMKRGDVWERVKKGNMEERK